MPAWAFHAAFVVPLVLMHMACALVFVVGVSAAAVTVFCITALLQIIGITLGFHRLLSHRSFKTSRTFQFLLALCGVLAGQNGPLWWVGHHRNHHHRADQPGDTHSPRAGFWWAHAGWLLSPRCMHVRRELVGDLQRLPEMRWLERYYYLVPVGYGLSLYALGGFQLVVWGSVLSTVCVYHIIWSANSICHRFGTRRFPTRDDSRNNIVVAVLTFGDGWHHNHHYVPYSARHGFRWWELDLNYLALRLLAFLGIVWELKLPPEDLRR
jgi:stearoyl-CoA desaturase (delta-9 desaturase)